MGKFLQHLGVVLQQVTFAREVLSTVSLPLSQNS